MKIPWVSRRYAEQLQQDVEYARGALDQMRRERNAAQEQSQRATDELIMRLGCAPITPTGTLEQVKRSEDAEKVAKAFADLMQSVDGETQLIDENLN